MTATLRPTPSSLVPWAALAVASAVGVALMAGQHDIGAAPALAATRAMAVAATLETAPAATVSVIEPDPEAFTIDGIEWWWAHPRAHPDARQ
jgi:hypothetical protein